MWTGGSIVPLLLALRAVEDVEKSTHGTAVSRRATAIDAWSAEASCVGQSGSDQEWWAQADHEAALQTFLSRVERHGLSLLCDVVRAPSQVAPIPDRIDLLHLDGNHAEQVVNDVERFCPAVPVGGLLVMDDVGWRGGHVARARISQWGWGSASSTCWGPEPSCSVRGSGKAETWGHQRAPERATRWTASPSLG